MTASMFILSFLFTLTLVTTPYASNNDQVINYWKSFYPATPIPSLISQHISQMGDGEIKVLTNLIKRKALPSHFSFFCNTANLICSKDEIMASIGNVDAAAGSGKCYGAYVGSNNPSISMHKILPGIFFRESVLKNGALFDMGELEREISPAKTYLPDSIASLLTLEASQVLFKNTTVKDMMSLTVGMCNSYIPQETRKCVSSVEALVRFPVEIFRDKRLKMLNPKSNAGSHTRVMLENIRPLLQENPRAKLVSCHELFFPYLVMYCHATSSVQLYEVDLVHPKTKELINDGMVAICHRDTSYWDPNHVSFRTLKTHAGDGEICHWMSTANLAWVHLDDTLAG